VRNEYVNAFIDRSTNWPKIKKREYKQGITMAEMTTVIMEHRAILITWVEKQEEMKRVQKVKPIVGDVKIAEDVKVPPDVKVPDVVIPNDEIPDNWEDIED
jgi:hypothetical protein